MVVKLGKYGAALVTPEESFWVPAFPVDFVADPTGAGDSFAGGFVGCIAAHGGDATTDVLKLAMAYGTALASFNVEEFGTERVARLEGPEIVERVDELRRITSFETRALALKG
jgi:sugar/nucleoside kinase (ribokinase family)